MLTQSKKSSQISAENLGKSAHQNTNKESFFTFDRYITDNVEGTNKLFDQIIVPGKFSQVKGSTGSGKTALSCGIEGTPIPNICSYIENKPELQHYNVIILTPLSTLANNTFERAKYAKFDVIVGGKENAHTIHLDPHKNRIICTYQQATTLFKRLNGQPTCWIIDELPEVVNAQYQHVPGLIEIFERESTEDIIVGITATPHKQLFEECWGFETYELKAKNPNMPNLHVYETKSKNFTDTILGIIENSDRQFLVFANEKELCDSITTRLQKIGIDADSVHSGQTQSQKESNKNLKSLNENKTLYNRVVLTTSYLSIGIDGKGFDIIYIANDTMGNDLQHFQQATARARDCQNVYLITQDSPNKINPEYNQKEYDIKGARERDKNKKLIANILSQQQDQLDANLEKLGVEKGTYKVFRASDTNDENNTIYESEDGVYKTSILTDFYQQKKIINQSISNQEFLEQIKNAQIFKTITHHEAVQESETTKAQKEHEKTLKKADRETISDYSVKQINDNIKGIDLLCEYVYNNTEDIGTKKSLAIHNEHVKEEKAKGNKQSYQLFQELPANEELWQNRFPMITNIAKNYCKIRGITGGTASSELTEDLLNQNTSQYAQSIKILKAQVRRIAESQLNGLYLRHIVKRYDQRELLFEKSITKEVKRIIRKKGGGDKLTYLELFGAYNSILKHSKYKPIDLSKPNPMRKILAHFQTMFEVKVKRKKQKIIILGEASILDSQTKKGILKKIREYKDLMGISPQKAKMEKGDKLVLESPKTIPIIGSLHAQERGHDAHEIAEIERVWGIPSISIAI